MHSWFDSQAKGLDTAKVALLLGPCMRSRLALVGICELACTMLGLSLFLKTDHSIPRCCLCALGKCTIAKIKVIVAPEDLDV
jgi:hypothetical protein